jgi:leucyl-tRNA synthetase
VNVTDLDGRLGKRETDTMGGFACSSWYFLRFCDPFNIWKPWSPEKIAYWMPVDCYVGGAEHAVMHLLYARFWTKVLFDEGLIPFKEPFSTLRNQGQVLAMTPYRHARNDEQLGVGEEGVKIGFDEAKELDPKDVFYRWSRMSKSKGNVVTPEEAIEASGADALRLYLLFKAPFEADIEWDNKGMDDLARFLSRVFRLVDATMPFYELDWKDTIDFQAPSETSRKVRRFTHRAIGNVTRDIGGFALNTYVSWLMKLVNELNPIVLKPRGANSSGLTMERVDALALSEAVDSLILLLAPGAPHSADELWEQTGHLGFTYDAPWPKFDPTLAIDETVTIAVQVNGKLRDTFEVEATTPSEEIEQIAIRLTKIQSNLADKTIRKVIVVPGKLVNIVAG